MDMYYSKPIVMDNGTALSKIGFAGEDEPRFIIPTLPTSPLRAKPVIIRPAIGIGEIRNKTIVQKNFIQGKSPLKRGIITDWVAMENFWNSVFYDKLRIDPARHPLIIAETPLNPEINKNKITEIMFEQFGVPSLLLVMQPSLSLSASGLTTGCIVDIGEGVTKIVPISEGYVLSHAIQLMDIAGQDITKYLINLLREAGYSLTSTAERQLAIEIKETLCFVSYNFNEELEQMKTSSNLEETYKTPDGEIIKIKRERFMAPECLFNPRLIGKEIPSLSENIVESISKCDMNLQRALYGNIILSGGSSNFPGIKGRLLSEISKNVPETVQVKVITPSGRELSTWIGGSIVGSLPNFSEMAVTKEQYFKGRNKFSG